MALYDPSSKDALITTLLALDSLLFCAAPEDIPNTEAVWAAKQLAHQHLERLGAMEPEADA